MRQIFSRIPTACLAIFLLVSATSPAQAQYFGRNKVQYKEFKFEVLKTDHFDVYFYEEERENAARVARMAERWYARLSKIFEHDMRTRQPLMLYASHPDFEQTNVVGGMIGEGTGGVTEGLKRRVVMPLAGTLAETDHVLGHELVHAFQYDMSARRASGGNSGGGIEALPLWFIEGLAEYLSIGPVDPHTAMWLRDATRQEELPRIKDLNNGQFFPYRWGQAVWAYVGGKYGDDLIGSVYRSALRSGDPIEALKSAALIDEPELSSNWHAAIREQYSPVMQATSRAHNVGRSLTAADRTRTPTNVSPSISPDGRHIVYFSSRDMFSIDLFLAETATGRNGTQAGGYRPQSTFHQPAVHWVRGIVEPRQPAVRARGCSCGQGCPRHPRRLRWRRRQRARGAGSRRDSESELVARWKVDCIFGDRRRRH